MSINKFAKITDGSISFAPKFLRSPGRIVVNPTEAEYLASGYYPYADDQPESPDGETVTSTRYELGSDGVIHALYTYGKIVQPPRVFSKLYLRLALEKRSLDVAFDAWVDAAGFRAKWTDCNELNEGYDKFSEIKAAAISALSITDETCEEILAEAVAR